MSKASCPDEHGSEVSAPDWRTYRWAGDPMKAMVQHYDRRCIRKGEPSIFETRGSNHS